MKALKNNMQKRNGQRSKIQCPFILHYFGFEVSAKFRGVPLKMYSGYQARNPERKRFTLFYTTQLLHTFIPRS